MECSDDTASCGLIKYHAKIQYTHVRGVSFVAKSYQYLFDLLLEEMLNSSNCILLSKINKYKKLSLFNESDKKQGVIREFFFS